MSIISSIEIIIAATFFFSVKNNILYILSVLLIAACIGGNFSILTPLFNKVYGIEIGPQVYGLCAIFIGLSSLLGPLLCTFFLKTNKDFLITFLIGGSFIMVKIYSLFMFNEEETYLYNDNFNYFSQDEIEDIYSNRITEIKLDESSSRPSKSSYI